MIQPVHVELGLDVYTPTPSTSQALVCGEADDALSSEEIINRIVDYPGIKTAYPSFDLCLDCPASSSSFKNVANSLQSIMSSLRQQKTPGVRTYASIVKVCSMFLSLKG